MCDSGSGGQNEDLIRVLQLLNCKITELELGERTKHGNNVGKRKWNNKTATVCTGLVTTISHVMCLGTRSGLHVIGQ